MKKILLSIIIVTYNNENQISACLDSLKNISLQYELIFVDNHSSDNTLKRISRFAFANSGIYIRIIENKINEGYAEGINQGLKASCGEYIALLGPDCRVLPEAFRIMIGFMQAHPNCGLVAPQLITTEGRIQQSCRRFPSYTDLFIELTGLPRLFPQIIHPVWKMSDFDHKTERQVQQPEASCVLTFRKAVEQIKGMDRRFPIFFSDVDWCRRFYLNGFDIWFTPEAKAVHIKGGSINQDKIRMIWKSHQGFYRYFKKYSGSAVERSLTLLAGFLLIAAAVFRSLVYTVKQNLQS